MIEKLILVDKKDQEIGEAEKLEAHQKGQLHRAFSIFIFREEQGQKQLLLQKRYHGKYHSGGLWTNTCCGHPRPRENILDAAERRLQEEMGFRADLKGIGRFHYIEKLDNGLTENEIDHIFIGDFKGQKIQLNPWEAEAFRWMNLVDLKRDLSKHPENYTLWLPKAVKLIKYQRRDICCEKLLLSC
ncbi:MAG: isopentenyl-diphosphate Delta-isomerase [Gammaproteobacteria bacterium]|nr:isopentenyl-diphosphate Delta-isomerase [Gammaproteobacteria bacterium]